MLYRLFEPSATPANEDALRNAFEVLCSVPAVFDMGDGEAQPWCERLPEGKGGQASEEQKSSTPRWLDPAQRRRAFSDAWLAFLRLQLPADLYKVCLFPCTLAVGCVSFISIAESVV